MNKRLREAVWHKAQLTLVHPKKTWNNLPEDIITASSVNSFINKLNVYWKYLPMKYTPYDDGPKREAIKQLRRIKEAVAYKDLNTKVNQGNPICSFFIMYTRPIHDR